MTNQDDQNAQDGAANGNTQSESVLARILKGEPVQITDDAKKAKESLIIATPVNLIDAVTNSVLKKERPRETGEQIDGDGEDEEDDIVEKIGRPPFHNPAFKAVTVSNSTSPNHLVVRAPITSTRRFSNANETIGSSLSASNTSGKIFSRVLVVGLVVAAGVATFYRKNLEKIPNFLASSAQIFKFESPKSEAPKEAPKTAPVTAYKAVSAPAKPIDVKVAEIAPKPVKVEPKVEVKIQPKAVETKTVAAQPAPKVAEVQKFDWSIPAAKQNDVISIRIEAAKKEVLKVLQLYPNNKDVETVVKSIFIRLGGNKVNAIDFNYAGIEKNGETFVRLMNQDKSFTEKNINDLKRGEHARIASAITGGMIAKAFVDYAGKEVEVTNIVAKISTREILPAANDYFNTHKKNSEVSLFPQQCIDGAQNQIDLLEAVSPSKAATEVAKALSPTDKFEGKEHIERAQEDLTQPVISPDFLEHINSRIESVHSIDGVEAKLDNLSAILQRGSLSLEQLVALTKQNHGKLELV